MSTLIALPPLAKNCWCTPEVVLSPLRKFAGRDGIGLDPCSNPRSLVGARESFSLETGHDGLTESWTGYGLVYVNPPYSGGQIQKWVDRIDTHARMGVELIALVPANVETTWFRKVWCANALCFWSRRIRFVGAPGSPKFASVVAYWGKRPDRFSFYFSDFGKTVQP